MVSVYLASVGYLCPGTLLEALAALESNPAARPLAGGQTLINVLKGRMVEVEALVDLNRVDELRGITPLPDGGIEVGAMATLSDVAGSSVVLERRPVLAEVVGSVADIQVRNRGTIGGNVCASDPTNHLPPLLVALGATLTIATPGGERVVPADEFFLGVYETAVGQGELLSAIRIPAATGSGDHFASVTIGREGTCIVNATAVVGGGSARIVIGCVAPVPIRATTMESRLAGRRISEPVVRDAASGLGESLTPPADVHASDAYRRHLAAELSIEAVLRAYAKSN